MDQNPLLSVLDSIKEAPKIRLRTKRKASTPVKRRKSLGYSNRLLGISSPDTKRGTVSNVNGLGDIPKPVVNSKGHILIATDFTFDLYSRVFSPHLELKSEENNLYLFTSGTLSDILHYSLLHCGIRAFREFAHLAFCLTDLVLGKNIDVKSFYFSYYRHCEPQEIVNTLERIWEVHTETKWPTPYNSVSCEQR